MPNRSTHAAPLPTPGTFLMGDAFNMRHPLTGGGMTVALSDIVMLRNLLMPLHDLYDSYTLCQYLESFYTLRKVEPGLVLRGPLENTTNKNLSNCELEVCPMELIHPPEDCNVNSTLSFTLQICRVEEIIVEGSIEGFVVHFQWVKTVIVQPSGTISASELDCIGGAGKIKYLSAGPSGGGGHGGRGGNGYYNDTLIVEGGRTYGDADFPCELGSGSGNASLGSATAGGGIIVIGSLDRSLSSLYIYGSLTTDGESFGENIRVRNGLGPNAESVYFRHA